MNSSPVLGILGGGQLARMTAYAAFQLGMRVHIFERFADSPAGQIAHKEMVGETSDAVLLKLFASECDLVTLESEFINESYLANLEEAGIKVYPSSASVGLIQDKLIQKQTMERAGIPVAGYAAIANHEDAREFGRTHGYPFLLKTRRGGYDGYGNATVKGEEDIAESWERITRGDTGAQLYAERFIPFVKELAVMIARARNGEIAAYPLVETVQENHICRLVTAPAAVSDTVSAVALECARKAVEAIEGVGIFGVEMFLTEEDHVLVNEMAPRPHNSGHYTIEGCIISQFENHIRAVMDWPLGATDLRAPAAAMVNILGRASGSGALADYLPPLSFPNAHLHIYGKREERLGRKMGHITALAASIEDAVQIAQNAEQLITFDAM